MDGVAGISAWSCWRSVVACWGACRYSMGSVSAHEAQYAGAAVMAAEVSPRPPRRGRCARATVVAGRLAASRRLVRHLSGGGWWQHAEQVVAPSAGAVEGQEPRCLEVVQGRDVVQKSLVAGPGLAEAVSLVFWCAKGGSEDSEPSLLGRECRVSDPYICSKTLQVGRRDARKVPDSGLATVELDVCVGVEVVCQEIVHGFHPMWLDHCVDIVQVSIEAFAFVELGMDGLDGRVLPQRKQC